MAFFKKRETPVENIAFLAICTGIDAVFALIIAFLPGAALFLMLAIPLVSAFAAYYCKSRYFLVYVLAAIGVCLAVSAWDISSTLFYVIPSLLTGAIYGFGIKNNLMPSLVLFISSILQFALFYAAMAIVKVAFEIDIQAGLLALFSSSTADGFPLFVYGYSLAQIVIAHFFIYLQMPRLGGTPIKEGLSFKWGTPITAILFGGISIALSFFLPSYALLSLGLSIFWGVQSIVELVEEKRKVSFVLVGVFALGGFLLFAGLYRLAAEHGGLALLGSISIAAGLAQFVNLILLRLRKENPKILP